MVLEVILLMIGLWLLASLVVAVVVAGAGRSGLIEDTARGRTLYPPVDVPLPRLSSAPAIR